MRREDMWPLLNAAPPPSGRGCCLGWSRAPRVSIAKVTAADFRPAQRNLGGDSDLTSLGPLPCNFLPLSVESQDPSPHAGYAPGQTL